jgi:tetratricopeptide (TPR) repeat protein
MTYRPKPQFWQPDNWQDFEELCYSLWKTIWDDPATQRHGRTGQSQYGVDIYGQPDKGTAWAGVQCKGKENFTEKQLTESELIAEVDKAKKFKPAISEFIVATTAPRDEKIQEAARKITDLHKSAGLFPVSVCAWNDIEERLLEHKPPIAKDWYPFLSDDPLRTEFRAFLEEYHRNQTGTSTSPPNAVSKEMPSFQKVSANEQRAEYVSSGDSPISTKDLTHVVEGFSPPSQGDVRALVATVDRLVAQLTIQAAEGSSSGDNSLEEALTRVSHKGKTDVVQPSVPRINELSDMVDLSDQAPQAMRRASSQAMNPEDICANIQKLSASPPTDAGTAQPTKSDKESFFDESESLDILSLPRRIHQELAVWNYDAAGHIAKRLEQAIQTGQNGTYSSLPKLLFLLSRVHVIRAETQDSETEYHVAQAKEFLTRIDEFLPTSPNSELSEAVEALRCMIDNIENGPDAALARLADLTNPYAIRIRLAMLMKKQDLDSAIALIEGRPLHLNWCDLATTVFASKDRCEDALVVVKWVKEQHDRSKFPQCVVRLADASFARALVDQEPDRNILPQDLSDAERIKVLEVIEILRPVLDLIIAVRSVDSELGVTAVKIAWRAHLLLGQREDVATLAQLMYTHRPVPVDVARSVVSGYMAAPKDLPARLREDHPNDLDANILAAFIQSTSMGQHEKAFAEAKKLCPLADTDEKREELFKLFQQIWQDLEGNTVSECEQVATPLIAHNPGLQAVFDGSRALRDGKPDAALKALDMAKDEDDVFCLQLRANALIQKGQLGDAVDLLLIAAKKTGEPILLHKTADIAFQAERAAIAVECYEKLLESQPDNLIARGNLASLYTFHLHDIGKAATQFQALHEGEPDNQAHTVNLAVCLSQLYQPKESLALYEEACLLEQPDLRAVLGRAELHLSLCDPDAAIASLKDFRETFWGEPNFLIACMNTAYAAGDEELAHEAFKVLNELHTAGEIDASAFRMVKADEGLEMFKQSYKAAEDSKKNLHTEMLKGRMPWVWAAQISGDAVYWAWRMRTQKMVWIGDDPVNRANFCIYATNAFHSRETEDGHRALLPLECAQEGTRIVAEVSALITLHRLGLLYMAADYFGEILVPQGYLPIVLEDGKKMVLHQRSRQQTAERISKLAIDGTIVILSDSHQDVRNIATADEYSDSDEHRYHLTDLIQPVFEAGLVDDTSHQRISKAFAKPSSVNDEHPALAQFQDVLIELSTLETLTTFGLLDAITGFYRVHISTEARVELRQRIEAIQFQEETRSWHFDLWNRIRNDSRFTFVAHSVPEGMQNKDADPKNFLAFYGSFIAMKEEIPLLADDRVCQALTRNERKDAPHAAFGTDSLIYALEKTGRIDSAKAAESILRLMQWRYRFVLPSAGSLKTLAEQYRTNPPGRPLQAMAEYLHDCMRDMGLFGGPEQTHPPLSMATRLYLSWLSVLAEFLIQVWDDDTFSEDAAKQLTDWCVREFLPSHPSVVNGSVKVRIGSMTARLLLSHALINANTLADGERASKAMKAMKDALKISDDEYMRIVTGILNDTKRTES